MEIGRRLQSVVGGRDVLARLGGDEFAVLLPGVDEAGALGLAQALRSAVGGAFELHLEPERADRREPVTVHVEASVGLAACPGTAATRSRADAAARTSRCTRRRPRAPASSATPSVDTSGSLERLRTIQDLRRLLDGDESGGRDGGELQVHLQPQAVPGSGRVARRRGARAAGGTRSAAC